MNSTHMNSHRNLSIHSIRSTPALLFLLSSLGLLTAADLDAARQDLWDARWRYRHDFVDANGPYSGDLDRLRDNWIAGDFTVRNTLLRARDAFVAATDEPETSQYDPQEARMLLAETIAELLSGHLSHGNFLLIDALKTRYPFLDSADSDPGRPAADTWALKANGSIDAEVQEIDNALIEFGIGIKGASALLDRPDIVLDPHTGKGILRAKDPEDFYAGFPSFVYTDQMRQLFRNLDDPNFQPFGNTDQFIPPTDKPVAQYIVDARDAAMSAITAEREYREQARDNNRRQAELEEFFLREDEFGVQILSVQDAQFRIQQAYNTLQNIPRRIQIEEDRSDSVLTLIYDANTRVNATEEALAWAGSFSVGASATIGWSPAFTASVNFNPLSYIVARLQRERNNIQAH